MNINKLGDILQIKWFNAFLGVILGINIFFVFYFIALPLTGVILGSLCGGWLTGLIIGKKLLTKEDLIDSASNGIISGIFLGILFWSFLSYSYGLDFELFILSISLILGGLGGLGGLWWNYCLRG